MQPPSLTVKAFSHHYPVWVGSGLLAQIGDAIRETSPGASSVMVITDENVNRYYGDDVKEHLERSGYSFKTIVVPAGESSKSISSYEQVLTAMLQAGLDRKSLVIALGGGVVGDLAGFAAATYMRGIPFLQVPTTLLAHDSSVGGKTGINHPLGKNMIGAFHAPAGVLFDSDVFNTLTDAEWRSGFAEVIKHGFIRDPEFLSSLVNEFPKRENLTGSQVNQMLEYSISIKASIVEEDEREQGIRAYLNFGHTLGHAVEGNVGYGEVTHGEAVVIGMRFAILLGDKLGMQPADETAHIFDFLDNQGYQLSIPDTCTQSELLKLMRRDKKSTSQKLNFVLLNRIGDPELREVDEETVCQILDEEGVRK
ncbi:3-dehydroquinate synthase [Salisediminibacterium selenitireducens]|uniref:3-dehydroquinate synthase n=1 Tax=Bacillus selenitireducens (strain ATCC 700615 / DSM 15326 / MLS10) TaxID=439292 RepID=D6XV94_BACIE|nr:3-dehydroquinate synthase [Salisediminibacterium selenitireducens]ADH99632.1 3-dehydroquinate synthase [[Bacillus] selenitireducens MLS10]